MYTTFVIQRMSFSHCRILFVRNTALLTYLLYIWFISCVQEVVVPQKFYEAHTKGGFPLGEMTGNFTAKSR